MPNNSNPEEMCKQCILIGISDNPSQWFPPDVEAIIARGRVFSGGSRHQEMMTPRLPQEHQWITITTPLAEVFRRYDECDADELIVFASGDPLFYGFAATVRRERPGWTVTVYPSFHSLQLLAHRLCLPYQDMRAVSLTGRPWNALDEALIRGEHLIGCLTDRTKTPEALWQRLTDYGYDRCYTMTVGERLGNPDHERVGTEPPFAMPNCVILRQTAPRPRPFGIPEKEFHLLDGRERMITKMPARLLALSMLDLHCRHSFWDVGFCTGSVSIEAKLQFPHLIVTSFEVRPECEELMMLNSRRHGTPGIRTVMGDVLEADLDSLPRPDAVFLGGHGGRLCAIVHRLCPLMTPGATLVFNAVSDESRQLFYKAVAGEGLTLAAETRLAIDNHNPLFVLKAVKNDTI